MADNLKPGDVVQLKSGGPLMTVQGDGYGNSGDLVLCMWFDGAKQVTGTFHPSMLEKESGADF
jgi:uncharacterized protein YodC (DUF2158 family)